MLVPAHYPEASKIKEVAVLHFDGQMGNEIASYVESVLAQADVGGNAFFTVVDRTRLKNIVESEMKLSMSALINPETAVKIGRLVGARGIYTGIITASNTYDERFNERRTKCVESKKREKPKWYESKEICVKEAEYSVQCTKRTATFAFTPKLIEVETGRVIYSQSLTGIAESKACSDDSYGPKSAGELIKEAIAYTINMFKRAVIPYYVSVELKIMGPDEGVTSKESAEKIDQGIEFAKNNRLDRACELWEEAKKLSQGSTAIFYNLGICAEVTGDMEQALDQYRNADKLLVKPDDRINEALARVQKRIDDMKKLK